MDNLTHTLFGLTLARTPLGRAGRGTTAALVVASNAPDLDAVAGLGGAVSYLRWHRGPTHGVLGIVFLALLTAAGIWSALRLTGRRRRAPVAGEAAQPAPFRMLLAISLVGVLGHVLMDLPTSYGTRLLSPFDWRWFTLDWMPIIDVYLLAALAGGLMAGVSPEARRRSASIVLALVAADYGIRAVAHRQALHDAPRLFGPTLPRGCVPRRTEPVLDYWPRPGGAAAPEPGRRCLVELVALPTFLSPFKWRIVAHLSNAYEIHDLDLFDERLRRPPDQADVFWRMSVRVPNIWTPPVWAAASTEAGRAFLGFARLPAARAFADASGTATVRWNDMRFAGIRPSLTGGTAGPFSVVIRIASDGRVLEQKITP